MIGRENWGKEDIDMQNKNVPFVVASVASLVIMLFLPFMSYGGYGVSLWEIITEVGFDAIMTSGGIGDIALIVAMAGGVAAVVGGLMNKKVLAQWGSVAAAGGFIVFFIALIFAEVPFDAALELLGMGFWLSIVGFAISASLAKNIQE